MKRWHRNVNSGPYVSKVKRYSLYRAIRKRVKGVGLLRKYLDD